MKRALSRRAVLRGTLAGGAMATIGLPLLDAMVNLGGTALADGTDFPHRFVLWFWGNGSVPGQWAPSTTGSWSAGDRILRGFAGIESKVHVLSGMQLPVLGRNNQHAEGATGMLTGRNAIIHPSYEGGGGADHQYMTVAGPSIDHVAAGLVGETRFGNITLAVTPIDGASGGPGTAVRYISHSGSYAYSAPTFDPGELFEKLFGVVPPDADRASVLDAVLDEANALSSRISLQDQARLSNHMDAIRDLEIRVRTGTSDLQCTPPEAPLDSDSSREQARLFAELVAMAFSCDLTRVASMQFSRPASHNSFPDVFTSADLTINGSRNSFHGYEHQRGYNNTVVEGVTYFHDVFSDFLHELDAVPEGDGTVLDHSLVVGTSELAGGAAHTFDDYPVFLCGGANGCLAPGAHHVRTGGNASDAMLTALRAIDPTVPSWGADQLGSTDAVESVLA